MCAPTHITFSWFIYLLVLTTTGVPLSPLNGLAVAVSAVLPDIDTDLSGVGRLVPSLARWLQRSFGHRTITHSLFFIGALALVLLPLAAWDAPLYACFLTGYTSHSFLDTMTLRGVRLLYPVSNVRCVFPLEVNHPDRYRTTSGSRTDYILGILFLLACIPAFLIARQGYERFIRFTQRNIESAVRDYNEFSRTHQVYAEILAHNLLTKEHVDGRFRIIGALNQHTLVFRDWTGRLRSLGNEYQADYAAERVLCERGEPVRVVVRQVNLTAQPLSQLLATLDPSLENQLFGRLSTSDRLSLPAEGTAFSPVAGSSGSLRLSFALPADLQELGLENLFVEHGAFTVRTFVETGAPADSLTGQLPGPAPRFARVAFPSAPGDSIALLCRKGDTVAEGERLACWGEMVAVQAEMDLINEKLAALGGKLSLERSALRELLGKALLRGRDDSLNLVAAAMMVRKGYAPRLTMEKAAAAMELSRRRLAALRERDLALERRTHIEAQALRVRTERLAARRHALGKKSEACSPVNGIVVDITRSARDGKMQTVFLLRSF